MRRLGETGGMWAFGKSWTFLRRAGGPGASKGGEQWQWYSGKAGKIFAEIGYGAATTPPRYNAKPLEELGIQQRYNCHNRIAVLKPEQRLGKGRGDCEGEGGACL